MVVVRFLEAMWIFPNPRHRHKPYPTKGVENAHYPTNMLRYPKLVLVLSLFLSHSFAVSPDGLPPQVNFQEMADKARKEHQGARYASRGM